MSRITSNRSRILFAGFLASSFAGSSFAAAATQSTLHNFSGADGNRASASLIVGADGNFFGTTAAGGNQGAGSVFRMSSADGSITTLYNFSSGNTKNDGGSPQSPLVLASDGNYYGSTRGGGSAAAANAGTIFQLSPSSNTIFKSIHVFQTTEGSHPLGGLTQVGTSLYGTTSDGGANNFGTIFSIPLSNTSSLVTLYNFKGTDGAYPMAGIIEGADGNLYGTTFAGGTNNCGTIFQLKPAGASSTLTTLHSFSCSNSSGQEQGAPMAALVQGLDGTLYGTTTAYGLRSGGTLFSIKPDGSGFTTLYTFSDGANGLSPQAGLILGSDGNLYGTTPAVGQDNNLDGDTNGTVFAFNPSTKVLTTLWGFSTSASGGTNSDGWNSIGGLVQGADGNLYGATANGGSSNAGTAYKITPATSLPAPLTISVSPNSVLLGDSPTLTWALASKLNTGGSASQCFAGGNDSNWSGLQAASGTLKLTSNKLGTFTYSLTCGGTTTAVTTLTVSAISAPTGLTAVPGDGQITLSWTGVSGAASYNIYEGIGTTPSGTPAMTGVTATTQTITGLTDGVTYIFKVSAVTTAGQEGPKSASVAASPTATATTPQNLVATAKDGSVLLTWDAASGANSYNIYQATTAGGEGTTPSHTGVAASGAPSYLVTGLTNGTTYYFEVASVNRAQTSAPSSEASATPQPAPAAPTGVAATAGDGTATITWARVTGAASYDIYETPASGSTVKIGSVADPTTSFTVNGLTDGTVYAFNIVAVNTSGSSAPSATVTVTPQAPAKGGGGAFAPGLLLLLGAAAFRRRVLQRAA